MYPDELVTPKQDEVTGSIEGDNGSPNDRQKPKSFVIPGQVRTKVLAIVIGTPACGGFLALLIFTCRLAVVLNTNPKAFSVPTNVYLQLCRLSIHSLLSSVSVAMAISDCAECLQ